MTTRLIRDKPCTLADSLSERRSRPKRWRWPWLVAVGLLVLGLSPLLQPSQNARVVPGIEEIAPVTPAFAADCPDATAPLQDELTTLSRSFNGYVGIAVAKVGCSWVVGDRLDELFPQQSVSKLWVALAVLDQADGGKLRLEDRLTIRPRDLTLFNQPMRQTVLENGLVERSVASLMSDALSRSDNTANDRLLWAVGGPDRVRSVLRRKDVDGIRFGPGERLMQSEIAGIEWSQNLSLGRNFEEARARLDFDRRNSALARYIADPVDGAMPSGIVRALARLADGQLLSPESTAVMMDILSNTRSGPRRLKAGAPAGWTVYHKTGTGQELGPLATGYNDVGILQAPDGTRFAVAVMIARTTDAIPARMEMMQEVTRAVVRFHEGGGVQLTSSQHPEQALISHR